MNFRFQREAFKSYYGYSAIETTTWFTQQTIGSLSSKPHCELLSVINASFVSNLGSCRISIIGGQSRKFTQTASLSEQAFSAKVRHHTSFLKKHKSSKNSPWF